MSKIQRKVRIFSALEVANLCGVVNQTAINWIRNGYLKAFTTPGGQYRVYAEDLSQFLSTRGMKLPLDLIAETRSDLDYSLILIVDDDKMLNDLVKRYCEKTIPSLSVLQAFDGFEAGALLAEQRPGFVVLDVDLPGVDGYKICHRIKTDSAFGKPYVVAMTGLDEAVAKNRMLAAGADAFLSKPLDFDSLVSIISEYAGKVRDTNGQ